MEKEEKLIWIKKVEAKGKKFLVYINDEEEGISFTEDQIVANRIIKGNSFYEKDFKKILDSLTEGVMFEKALKYIDYKPRTEKEIRTYLIDHAVDEKSLKNIVKKLKDIKFIDDDRYAKIYIEEEMRHQKGPNVIKHVLITKGVNEDIITKYLANYSRDAIYDNALDMGKKTLKTVIGLPLAKQKESVYTRLYRMGFDYSVINKVLSVIEYSDVDLDRLKGEYQKLSLKELDNTKIVQKLLTKGYNYSDIKQVINDLKEE